MHRGFSARTLAMVQAMKNAYLTERATIETESSAVDEYGASTHTWELVATNVPCRLIVQGQSSNSAEMLGNQEGLIETYKAAFKLGLVTLAVNQRVAINSIVYQVVDILSHRTDQDEVQAILKRDVR